MNYQSLVFSALLVIALFGATQAETVGVINFTVQDISITTGIFGNTVGTCNSDTDCLGYKCLSDYNSENHTAYAGWCKPTTDLSCYSDKTPYTGFNPTLSGTKICVSNTTYRSCSSGVWSSSSACSSGQTCSGNGTCSTASSSSTTTTGSSSTGTTTTSNSSANRTIINITAVPSPITLYQGNWTSGKITFKNSGNNALINVKLTVSGIPSSWYNTTPATISVVGPGNSNSFTIDINLPEDADVGSYTVTFTLTTTGASDSESMSLKVLPTEQTNMVIEQTFADYTVLYKLLQENLTVFGEKNPENESYNSVKILLNNARSKLRQANESIVQKDYYTAKLLLDEAKGILDAAQRQMYQVVVPENTDYTIIIIIVGIVVIVIIAFLLWPTRRKAKNTINIVKKFRESNAKRHS
jgi:hypothetical protein